MFKQQKIFGLPILWCNPRTFSEIFSVRKLPKNFHIHVRAIGAENIVYRRENKILFFSF